MNDLYYENTIPLLDLGRFDAAEIKERTGFLSELRDAARQAGFSVPGDVSVIGFSTSTRQVRR